MSGDASTTESGQTGNGTDDGDLTDDLPLAVGALAGGGTYVLGYLLTYLLAGEEVRQSALTGLLDLFAGEPTTWKVVGWLFYNAHMVETVVPGFPGSRTIDLIAEGGGSATLLYLVPPILLLAAGLLVVRQADGDRDATDGAFAGTTVVLGYLPLAVVGAFVFAVEVADATMQPEVGMALILAGLVYPVAFGALGGALGSQS